MSERPPEQPESDLDVYKLGPLSLNSWHARLTTDQETGEPNGHLATPGSRYGDTSDQVSWWALAAQSIYQYVGDSETTPESVEYFMGLAVNDDPGIYELTKRFKYVLPRGLKQQLDWKRAKG